MANEKNLKKYKKGDVTHEEAVKRGRLGGRRSAIARKERKLLKEVAAEHLLMKMSNGKSVQENLFLKAEKLAFENSRLSEVIKFIELLRDTSGQKPVEKVAQTDANGNDVPVNDLSKVDTATLIEMAKAAGVADDDADKG